MFYRVIAILNFTVPDEGKDFYHDCELAIAKSNTINPGQPNEEKSSIEYHQCFHDENPSQPCLTLAQDETP